jgi:hypothetical protein
MRNLTVWQRPHHIVIYPSLLLWRSPGVVCLGTWFCTVPIRFDHS